MITQSKSTLYKLDAQILGNRKITRKWNLAYHAYSGVIFSDDPILGYFQIYAASGTDYEQNYVLLDRRGTQKMGWVGTNQVLNNEGTFKNSNFGGFSLATLGIDIKRDGIPVSVYGNYGFANSTNYYEVGANLHLGFCNIYLPFSTTVMTNFGPENFTEYAQFMRIGFKINIFQPYNSVETLF